MSDPEPLPAPAKAKAPKTPRQRLSEAILAVLLIVMFFCSLPVLLFAVPDWWDSTFPTSAFKRTLGEPIPKSVVVHKRWGVNALARTDEWLLFSASSNGMQRIIQRNGFIAFDDCGPLKAEPDAADARVKGPPKSPDLWNGQVVIYGNLLCELDECKTQGFTSHVRYALRSSVPGSSKVLHVDASGTRALYHRAK
ncbi:MAG: hypothetical protein U1F77_20515 [Kiritimatiellia bacterium]